MPCLTYCSISLIFLLASVFMFLTSFSIDFPYSYSSSLIKEMHQKLAKERMYIYMKGYIYGLMLSVLVLYFFKNEDQFSKNPATRSCFVSMVTTIFSVLYYKISPKSDYMFRYLTTQPDRDLYVYIYRKMQLRYYGGIFLGFVAALFIPAGLCNSKKISSEVK